MSRPTSDGHPSGAPEIAFSLIVSTIGQTRHFRRLLDSLVAQSLTRFEVIVVDQSVGDAVRDQIDAYRGRLTIVHATSSRGVSRGRNRGLELARGTFVAFPDDDCWYSPDLLRQVAALFADPAIDGVFGRCLDEHGRNAAGRHARGRQPVDRYNVWNCGVSASIFFRKSALDRIGPFDPSIGLGSGTAFLSGEETDVILRGLSLRRAFHYDPAVIVFHDSGSAESFVGDLGKAWSYALGMGMVLRRHRYGLLFVLYTVMRPMGGATISLCLGRFRLAGIRVVRAAGRLEGWRRSGGAA